MEEAINPFTKVRLWLYYELLEIEALLETFKRRKIVQQNYKNTISKVESNIDEMQKIENGKYTFSTFYRSKEGVQKKLDKMKESQSEWLGDLVNSRLHF